MFKIGFCICVSKTNKTDLDIGFPEIERLLFDNRFGNSSWNTSVISENYDNITKSSIYEQT